MRINLLRRHRRRTQSLVLLAACVALLVSIFGNSLIAVQALDAQSVTGTPTQSLDESQSQSVGQDEASATTEVDPPPVGDSPEDGPVIGLPGTESPSDPEVDVTEPSNPLTAPVRVAAFACPPGTDRTAPPWILTEVCDVTTDLVSFTLSGEGYVQTLLATAGIPQQAVFESVPFGVVSITGSVPTGYGAPLLYCSDSPAGGPGSLVSVPLGDATGSWEHRGGEGLALLCAFFHVSIGEDADPAGRDVHVSAYACAPGSLPLDDAYLLSEQCREAIAPVEFTMVAPGGWSQTQATDPGVPQTTSFGDVPFGLLEIIEVVPPGYGSTLAFCADTPADGPGAYGPAVVVDGTTIFWENRPEADVDLRCLFFNLPLDGEGAGNQLTLTSFACPPGTDPGLGLPDLGTTCETMPGVTFSLNDGPGQATDGAGTTTWTGLPTGPWDVTETVPPGYGPTPVVFCGPMYETEAPRMLVSGSTFGATFDAGDEHMVCTVFNFEGGDGDEGRDVHFSKYTCAPEIGRTDDWYALGESCFEAMDSVQLTVTVPGAGYAETKMMTPGAPQTATFGDVPSGTLYLEEGVPPGFGHPMVFCTDTPADGAGNYTKVEPWPESGAFIWEYRADATIDLTCLIFNFHAEDYNSVTVNKYACPPGVNAETDDLFAVCSPGGDGIVFDLVDGNGSHPAAVSGGTIEWTGVVIGAEGELQVIETIPPGYGEPWVVCDGLLMASAGGFVIPNPGEARPFHVVCDWFNFAQQDSTLSVVKHACPPGYDPAVPGANPEADCATLADGVEFHLAGPGGAIVGTTGDAGAGTVQFTELEPGNHVLVESVPADTAWSFVSTCYGHAVGAVRPFPLATGDTLSLTVYAGETIICHWFNVPDHDDTSLMVIKYTCATATYVSEIDCQIDERGATFDLVWWNGTAWEWLDIGTTDAAGRLTFGPIDPGEYWLDEHDSDWCHISSAAMSDDGNWLKVLDDEETVVKVYNCDGTPGKPGETPARYPNTGVPPAGAVAASLPMAPTAALGVPRMTLHRRRIGAFMPALPVTG